MPDERLKLWKEYARMLTETPPFNSNPGQYAKLPLLDFLVRSIEKPSVLEIGVGHGWGMLPLAMAAKAKGGEYIGVDVFIDYRVRPLLRRYGLLKFAFIFKKNSAAFWQELADDIDFDVIVIDGWHEYPNSHMDIAYAARHLSERGWLLVHDVLSMEGPARAFKEICCEDNGMFGLTIPLGQDGMGIAFITDSRKVGLL